MTQVSLNSGMNSPYFKSHFITLLFKKLEQLKILSFSRLNDHWQGA